MDRIYLDNAATTQISESVFEAMLPWLKDGYGNASSLHSCGREAARAIEEARKTCADCLNCKPDEIIFTSGGTESDNTAIRSLIGKKRKGCSITTTETEHHAILKSIRELQLTSGVKVKYLPVNKGGTVNIQDVTDVDVVVSDMVSVMAVNNEIGTIQPIDRIGRFCRDYDVPFHTDAVQAVGNIPIDVKQMKVDMLSLSGHKIHAPKGIGLLYCRSEIPFSPLIVGGGQQQGRRAGTENVAAIVGLAQALREVTENVDRKNKQLKLLEEKLIEGMTAIDGVHLNGDRESKVPSICNFTFDGVLGETLMLQLDFAGICVSTGSACTSGNLESSQVLKAIGLSDKDAHSSVRFSMSSYTTEQEIDTVLSAIPDIVKKLREYNK